MSHEVTIQDRIRKLKATSEAFRGMMNDFKKQQFQPMMDEVHANIENTAKAFESDYDYVSNAMKELQESAGCSKKVLEEQANDQRCVLKCKENQQEFLKKSERFYSAYQTKTVTNVQKELSAQALQKGDDIEKLKNKTKSLETDFNKLARLATTYEEKLGLKIKKVSGDGFKFVFLNFHDKGDQEAWVELTHSYQKKKLKYVRSYPDIDIREELEIFNVNGDMLSLLIAARQKLKKGLTVSYR